MRIKQYSRYNFFPDHNFLVGEPYIPCYNNSYISTRVEPNAIALMTEPRCLQTSNYHLLENNPEKFKLIFTYDDILLSTIPNAHLIMKGGVWYSGTEEKLNTKTKDISFCSSDKEMCHIHKLRKKLAISLENDIDCLGTYNGGDKISTKDIYEDYKFSVVIENYIDNWWFTEKICNAFANKCVPIYYGARRIGDIFDIDGIVVVDNLYDIPKIVGKIKEDIDHEYLKRIQAIQNNFERVKYYSSFENWFFRRYEGVLDKLYKGELDCCRHPLF